MLGPIAHTSVQIPTYTLEDLRLRAPKASDMPAYTAFCASDRAVGVGGPYPGFAAENRLLALIGHWHIYGYGRWIVADAETDAPLGVVGLMNAVDWPAPEIAWTVFEGAEGKSVAHRAATFARAYAYDILGWSTVVSCIAPGNTRSEALAQRMGAVHESVFTSDEIGTLNIWRHLPPEALT